MELQKRNERIDWIDIAKGIGIIFVMLTHSSAGFWGFHIVSFYMPLFFVLSGFTFKQSNDFLGFIKKKSKSLLIPYICITAILFFINIVTKLVSQTTIKFSDLYMPILGGAYSRYYLFDPQKIVETNTDYINLLSIDNSPLWFLTCLFVTEIMFYFIAKLKIKYMVISIALCSLVGYLISVFIPILLPWSVDTAFTCVAFIATGYLIKDVKINNNMLKIVMLVVFVVVNLFFGRMNSVNISIRQYNNYIYFYIAAFSGVGIYILASQFIANYIKTLKVCMCYLGKNSVIIFGFHLIFFRIITEIFRLLDIDLTTIQNSIIYGVIYSGLTILVLIPVVEVINKYVPWIVGKKIIKQSVLIHN